MKRQKTGFRADLERELDRLWSKGIQSQAHCQMCLRKQRSGYQNKLEPHHLIGRSYTRFRWVLDNGLLLCGACHQEAHACPNSFSAWLEKNKPDIWEWRNKAMTEMHEVHGSFLDFELAEIRDELQLAIHTQQTGARNGR